MDPCCSEWFARTHQAGAALQSPLSCVIFTTRNMGQTTHPVHNPFWINSYPSPHVLLQGHGIPCAMAIHSILLCGENADINYGFSSVGTSSYVFCALLSDLCQLLNMSPCMLKMLHVLKLSNCLVVDCLGVLNSFAQTSGV